MAELVGYVLSTVVLPAAIATALSAIALLLLPRRPAPLSAACVAVAVPLAFAIAFVREVDAASILRQLPIELPGDDAPYERWHRLGLLAAVLAAAAPAAGATAGSTRRPWAGTIAAALVSVGAALVLELPGASVPVRVLLGLTCLVATLAFARCSIGWLSVGGVGAFACVGAGAAASGFPSLAIVCTSTAVALAGVGAVARVARKRHPDAPPPPVLPVAIATGVLLGTASWCGWAYASTGFPAWAMPVAAIAGSALAALASRARPRA